MPSHAVTHFDPSLDKLEFTGSAKTLLQEQLSQTHLDEDLSKVESFMGDSKHPGLLLKEGHFGFAGHNDPVSFRNIKIKEL